MQLATKTGGLATSLPVFAGFETSLAQPFRAEFTTVLSPKKNRNLYSSRSDSDRLEYEYRNAIIRPGADF